MVEFGNALHQPLLDRFLAGASVPRAELQRVWRESIGGSASAATESPVYEAFYETARRARQRHGASWPRVLLGDPPFDWHRERDRLPDALDRRDSHFAEVVEIEVLRRGRRALLLAGGGHLARLSDVSGGNVLQRLERRHPACCFVVLTHYVFDDVVERRKRDVSDLERRLVHWPVPSMASIHGTWLGDVDAKLILGDTARRIEPDGTVFEITVPFLDAAGREVEPVRLADVADAYLYFGPTASLTLARPRPADLRTWEQWRASL